MRRADNLGTDAVTPHIPELDALDFAIEAHRGQMHGNRIYAEHLVDVHAVLLDYTDNLDILRAGFLHDVLEDTNTLHTSLVQCFGPSVAYLVWCVTGYGQTREEMCDNIKTKIEVGTLIERWDAALVKCADRIANVECSKPGDAHRVRYLNEQPHFTYIKPLVPVAMWQRLERALCAAC